MQVRFHERGTPPWQLLAVVALGVVLTMLGTLQYRWLGEVSEAERARMRETLRSRATDFAREFDRELTRLYLNFHLESDALDANAGAALADAFVRAQSGGGTGAGLVRDLFLVDAAAPDAVTLRRLDAPSRSLTAVDWPEALAAWRQRAQHAGPSAPAPAASFFVGDAVDPTLPALVVPVPRVRRIENGERIAVLPDPAGAARAVLVWLDADRLRTQLVEPLAAKYFGAASASEYIVQVVERDDPSRVVYVSPADARLDEQSADVTTGMFDLRMDEVNRFRLAAAPRHDGTPLDKVAITIVRRSAGGDATRVLMTGGDSQGAWQVRARPRGGSLEGLVARSRRRNLAISLGVLALLGTSFVLVFAAAQRQQRLARQQMEFVAAVSHELRTPLAVICSAGENLADGVVADAAQVKRYGALVETEGRRLGDMVERVLQFAGINAGTRTESRRDVDMAGVVADVVSGVAADARERGVTLNVQTAGAMPPILGDAEALRSAVQNIVGNAVKYSAGGGVDVTTDVVHDDVVRIRVADRGLGIDARDLPHIFKPFYRGRRAVEAQVRGSGIGLSVVLHVVRSHGGDVQVESRVGEGTTVTVVLPTGAAADVAPRRGRVVRLRDNGAHVAP